MEDDEEEKNNNAFLEGDDEDFTGSLVFYRYWPTLEMDGVDGTKVQFHYEVHTQACVKIARALVTIIPMSFAKFEEENSKMLQNAVDRDAPVNLERLVEKFQDFLKKKVDESVPN